MSNKSVAIKEDESFDATYQFLKDMRDRWQQKGAPARRLLSLDEEKTGILVSVARDMMGSGKVSDQDIDIADLEKLLEHFIKRAAFDGIDVTAEGQLTEFAEILAGECVTNARAFGLAPKKVISLTVYQGDDFARTLEEEEFQALKETPGIFSRTAAHYPFNPREYLRKNLSGENGWLKRAYTKGRVMSEFGTRAAKTVIDKSPGEILVDIRHIRSQYGLAVTNRMFQSPEKKSAVEKVAGQTLQAHGFEADSKYRSLYKMLGYMEEIASRANTSIPEDRLPEITSILLEEWKRNVDVFKASPEKLMVHTLYHGNSFIDAMQEGEFANLKGKNSRGMASTFKRAAIYFHTDPFGYIRAVEREKEVSGFMSKIRKQAKPRGRLKNVPEEMQAAIFQVAKEKTMVGREQNDPPYTMLGMLQRNAEETGMAKKQFEALNKLTNRFAEMAYRAGIEIPPEILPDIAGILLKELNTNCRVFNIALEDSIPLTLYQGLRFADTKRQGSFGASPGEYREAALAQPSDPQGYLKKLMKRKNVAAAGQKISPAATRAAEHDGPSMDSLSPL